MSQSSDADMFRIATSLERIATCMEKQAAKADALMEADPADAMRNSLEALMADNPVFRAAFEQTKRMIDGGQDVPERS